MFFFFKQKTAYEIKECDWSSDVCSSDLLILFSITTISAQEQTTFNSKDINTWEGNPEEVLKLDSEERNQLINNANPWTKSTVLSEIAIKISEEKVFARIKANKLVEPVNKARSLLGGKGNLEEEDVGIFLEKIKGFENLEIKLVRDNVLSDGNVEIDFDSLPRNIKEAEYVPAKGNKPSKLIYTFKDGGKATITKGSLKENNNG